MSAKSRAAMTAASLGGLSRSSLSPVTGNACIASRLAEDPSKKRPRYRTHPHYSSPNMARIVSTVMNIRSERS